MQDFRQLFSNRFVDVCRMILRGHFAPCFRKTAIYEFSQDVIILLGYSYVDVCRIILGGRFASLL